MLNFAICMDTPGAQNDGLFDSAWIEMHPGSGWLPFFRQAGRDCGAIQCASGDLALARVRSGEWIACETFVIDALDSRVARDLVAIGCIPFLQTALEAPIYAPLFYDRDYPGRYRYATRYIAKQAQTRSTLCQHFPSFGRTAPKRDTGKRLNRIVCVAANKYRTSDWDISMVKNRASFVKWLKHNIGKAVSPTYRDAIFLSLHNTRINVLSELATADILDLYGVDWDNEYLVPNVHREVFRAITPAWKGRAGHKHELIQQYDFGLCIENMEQPGYITEKIFDCLAAGVIPVYLGATDIADFVPPDTFVDLRALLKNKIHLPSFLIDMTYAERERFHRAGISFICSPEGDKYSYEGYAAWVADLAVTLC